MTRSLSKIGADLKALIPDPRHPVHDFATQLQGSGQVDLGGASLAGIYPPELMVPTGTPGLRWSTHVLELLRDTLIFVPVIYTWWQLAMALQAWQGYKGPDGFLLAWQEGFVSNGHQHAQPLSTSAFIVASVVLSVIGLTVIAQLLRGAYDASVQKRQRRLAGLLAEANLIINQSLITAAPDVSKKELAQIGVRISESATKLSEALGTSSASITSAVDANPGSKLHGMFKEWTDMAGKWAKSADELKSLGTRLNGTQDVVAQLRATQTALTSMQQNIQNETSRLLQALEQERTLSGQEAYTHHQLAEQVRQSTQELSKSLVGLSDRADQFNNMVHLLQRIVDRLDGGHDGGYS